MGSKLKQVQEYMIKYTETICSVLNIDIEIVDNRLDRISGTGQYKNKINTSVITEGYIYNQVFETQKEKIVLDIDDSNVCKDCEHYKKCKNKVIIAVPIKYNNQIIGVIGAISIDKEKKEDIKENMNSYLEFINHICDLIAIKIEEYEANINNDKKIKMLREIIDMVEKGVIILDTSQKISYINNIAMKKLNIKDEVIGQEVQIYSIESLKNEHELIGINLNYNSYKINSKIIPVNSSIKQYDKIIIFDNIHDKNELQCGINSKWGDTTTDNIIGKSQAMLQVKERTKKIAKSNSTVMITGESGTGKELIARSIHADGRRWNKPFIAINCAAIPETLLESELFGYVKGAFSGASNGGKIGKFELANDGVIFLDEIGDLSLHLQAKLLRVLQERKFARIGSNKLLDLDIRVIAATNKDLLELVNGGKFRDDLYYRLNVIPINLPPLRERKEDITDIMMKFIKRYSVEFDINVKNIEDDVINMLVNYNWPGNIRELENSVEYIMNIVGEDGIVSTDMVPLDILRYYGKKKNSVNLNNNKDTLNRKNLEIDIDDEVLSLKDAELKYISKLLDKYGKDTKSKKEIAKKLGIGLSTLYRKLEES